MIGGPYTQQSATGFDEGAVPMPDAGAPEQDLGGGFAFNPNSGLPRLMHMDGLPENAFDGTPITTEAGVDPMQPAPEQPAQPKADIQQSVTETPAADVVAGPEQRSGFRAEVTAPQFNQRYRYTQEDFYGPSKNITWTDPRGVQMYVPEAGRLPMAVWASRMQQVQGERQQNAQNMAKFMSELGKGIKTADPYQESLNNMVSAARNRFVQDLAAQYGGDERLAWKEIKEDPSTMQRFIDMHRNYEALGQQGLTVWNRARTYLDAVEKGGVFVDPKTRELAEDYYYGLGSMKGGEDIADINRLVRTGQKFENAISREEFAKQFIMPNLDKRYDQYSTAAKLRYEKGVLVGEWDDVKKLHDGYLEEAATSMTELYPATTYAENLEWLKRNIPMKHVKANVELRNPPESGGGSGGAKKGTFYSVTSRSLSEDVDRLTAQAIIDEAGDGAMGWKPLNGAAVPAITITENYKTAAPRAYESKGGGTVTIVPIDIVYRGGKAFIVGKDAKELNALAVRQDEQAPKSGGVTFEEMNQGQQAGQQPATLEANLMDFRNLRDVVVPYSDYNAQKTEEYFGLSKKQVMSMLEAKAAEMGAPTKAAASSAPTKKKLY